MCKKSIGYEAVIRSMTNKELFFKYNSVIHETNKLLEFNFFNCKEIQIPDIKKDFITLYLIEILRRMGSSVENIKETLRDHPLLQYKNGEEDIFLIESPISEENAV